MRKSLVFLIVFILFIFVLQSCQSSKRTVKLEDEKRILRQENFSLRMELSNLKEKVLTLADERDSLQKQFQRVKEENLKLKNLVESTKGDLGKQIESLKITLKANETKGNLLKEQILNKDEELNSLKSKIKSLSLEQAQLLKEKEEELAKLNATQENLKNSMEKEISEGELKIKQLGDVLNIDFLDKIFFEPGSADLKNNGKKVLDKLVPIFKTLKNKQIRVEGFTDNVPIAESYKWKFPSNWELSVFRAATIVRYLQLQGIDPTIMKATGYGEYNPVESNATEEGQAMNRRIDIQLVPLDVRARFKDK